MPDSNAKKAWMKENTIFISIKVMKRTEGDIVSYMEEMSSRGIGHATFVKMAIREYMENHPIGKEQNGV